MGWCLGITTIPVREALPEAPSSLMRPSIAHHGILWEQTHGGGKHGRNDQKGKSIWFPDSFFAVTAHRKTSVTPWPPSQEAEIHKGAIDSFRAHSHGSSRSCWVVHAHRLGISWPRTLVSHVNLNVSHCVQILGESEKQSMI